MSVEDEGVFNCQENISDYNIDYSEFPNNTNNTNTEVKLMSNNILERTKLAIANYKEGLVLVDKLDALNEKIRVAESTLESHINKLESIDITDLNNNLADRQAHLQQVTAYIHQIEDLNQTSYISKEHEDEINILLEESITPITCPAPDTLSSKDKEIIYGNNGEPIGNFHPEEVEQLVQEGYDTLTTEFKSKVESFQIKIDGKLGSYPQKVIIEYLQANSAWAVDRQSEILDYLNATGKIYPAYLKEIKDLISRLDLNNELF